MQTIERYVVASFDTHARAAAAVRRLGLEGIDLRRLAIVGKDFRTEQHALGLVTLGDTVRRQASRAASFGALGGLIFGSGLVGRPFGGPVNASGALLLWLLGGFVGALLGALVGAVGGVLLSRGPKSERPVKYGPEVQTGTFLVTARGSDLVLRQARAILGEWGAARPLAPVKSHGTHATRQSVLALLDPGEAAAVGTALNDGDEYLDLAHLDRGVQHVHRVPVLEAGLLPRKAVTERTWRAVLEHLEQERLGAAAAS